MKSVNLVKSDQTSLIKF